MYAKNYTNCQTKHANLSSHAYDGLTILVLPNCICAKANAGEMLLKGALELEGETRLKLKVMKSSLISLLFFFGSTLGRYSPFPLFGFLNEDDCFSYNAEDGCLNSKLRGYHDDYDEDDSEILEEGEETEVSRHIQLSP